MTMFTDCTRCTNHTTHCIFIEVLLEWWSYTLPGGNMNRLFYMQYIYEDKPGLFSAYVLANCELIARANLYDHVGMVKVLSCSVADTNVVYITKEK
jgi:hypothetical protein